jgi:hypothetical protein
MPVSGRSSETQSKPINMNKKNYKPHYEAFTTWTDVHIQFTELVQKRVTRLLTR